MHLIASLTCALPAILFLHLNFASVQHLGDFPHRLAQHCHAVYEYTPPPPLAWPELSDEIWCHRYYLANLCDEERFRGWPVVEHIPLLQVRGRQSAV
jgi:DnaJ family protein C protein 13